VNHAPIVPIVLPALTAALMLLDRRIASQRLLAWTSTLLLAGCAVWLVLLADDGWRGVYLLGNWAAPFGIALVADRLSVLMVAVAALLAVITLAAAHGGWDRRGEHFHPLLQIQLMGLNGAFMTGDLFNLFVFFEVLLIASYGLLLHGGGGARVAAGLRFVTLNLVGSSLFLIAATLLYGVTGTLNLADLSARMAGLSAPDATLARAAAWLLLVVFCLKGALLPLYFWLPGTYAAASPPVAALFAVMTKVGVYSVLRVHTLVFGAQAGLVANAAFPWLVAIAAAGYVLAMLGALASADLRRLAAMMVIASAAFLLIGVGLSTERSIAAAIYYLPHTTLAAAAMFLLADLVGRGRAGAGDALAVGPVPPAPALLGAVFVVLAIALAGLPPLGGFIGKAMLLSAMLPGDAAPPVPTGAIVALWMVVLAGSLIAMLALTRAGGLLFWQSHGEAPGAVGPRRSELAPIALAIAALAAIVIGAAPMQRYAQATAAELLAPQPLIDQVLRTVPLPGPHQRSPESFR
jgi:multicomponent K+:H+ antiporter subunit D